jgi:Flp pilus assembly protein protease CpaA
VDLLLLREIIVVCAVAAAAYTDYKTGLIYDWITYPLIAIGLLLNLFEFSIAAYLLAGIIFVAGYALYYTGKIGGGDVKLFTGISIVLPFLNNRIFIFDVIVAAAVVAVIFLSAYYVLKYARIGIKFKENKKGIVRSGILGIGILVYFAFLLQTGIAAVQTIVLFGITMLFALVFLALENGIRKNFFLERVNVEELEEDELIAADELDATTKQKIGIGVKGIADDEVLSKIKESGITMVPVYRNLPKFAPFVLVGCVTVVVFGNALAGIFF